MRLKQQNRRLVAVMLALVPLVLSGCGGGGGAGTAPVYSGIDTIDTAIDWFFGTDATATATPAPEIPATPIPDASSPAPVDAESALDLAALEAVFAMVDDLPDESIALSQSRFPPKPPGVFRAAILLPLSGQFAPLGKELRQAVDLAVLSLQQPRFEVIFIDSQPRADDAVREAIAAQTDMIIGPVFASATQAAVPVAADYGVPVLSFSNTAGVSASGAWILGQRPEQEIDAVMRYALYELRRDKGVALADARVAVIRDANNYGRKLSAYAVEWLRDLGVSHISPLTLTSDDLANEASVRQVVQDFIGWVDGEPVISNETLAILAADPPLLAAAETAFEEEGLPAPFDIILFCGSTDFTLRVAPVLAWHDLDAAANVRFVGTSQWNRREAISEPSLQGGVFASPPQESRARFDETWQRYYQTSASPLAPLGYDAVAIASAVASDRRRVGLLQQGIDFVGFSGAFRLMPDGSNDRHVELRRIRGSTSSAIFIPQVVEDAIAAALRPERPRRGRGGLFF